MLRPVACFRPIADNLTRADLSLDAGALGLYRLAEAYRDLLSGRLVLCAQAPALPCAYVHPEPGRPHAVGDEPREHIQHLYTDRLDAAVDALAARDAEGRLVLRRHGDRLTRIADPKQREAAGLAPVLLLFTGFPPAARPVPWRTLLAGALIGRVALNVLAERNAGGDPQGRTPDHRPAAEAEAPWAQELAARATEAAAAALRAGPAACDGGSPRPSRTSGWRSGAPAAAGVPAPTRGAYTPWVDSSPRTVLRPALAAAAATCSGNGLARFAFVPLFPALVGAGWVDGAEAGLLGAAALLGYLIGILAGQPAARRLGVPRTLDIGMALVVLALAACAWNGGFWWFGPWRVLAGVAGGFLMALAGPAAQASVPAERRGTAAGIAIGGVGLGISLGAVAVPALLPAGLPAVWLGLAALVALLWAAARPRWPDMPMRAGPGATTGPIPGERLLLLAYAFHAAGMVPPMIYLADLAARGRGLGVGFGAVAWLLFGLGATAGGVASGRVVDRIGGLPAFRLWLLVQALAVGMALPPFAWLMAPTALAAGLAAMGVTTVALSVSRELAPGGDPQRAAALWVRCTAVFAVVQTAAGFALAGLFAATGESHAAVFAAGLAASLAAFAAAAALARAGPPPRAPTP